ncbi:MAG: hypothetical protein U0M96_03935 [Eggerthellaceae bacterium]
MSKKKKQEIKQEKDKTAGFFLIVGSAFVVMILAYAIIERVL